MCQLNELGLIKTSRVHNSGNVLTAWRSKKWFNFSGYLKLHYWSFWPLAGREQARNGEKLWRTLLKMHQATEKFQPLLGMLLLMWILKWKFNVESLFWLLLWSSPPLKKETSGSLAAPCSTIFSRWSNICVRLLFDAGQERYKGFTETVSLKKATCSVWNWGWGWLSLLTIKTTSFDRHLPYYISNDICAALEDFRCCKS